jgi:hypothetical protein
MKKRVLFLVITTVFLGTSCQQETDSSNGIAAAIVERNNWNSAKLGSDFSKSQQKVSAYLFDKEKFQLLGSNPKVNFVKFVLGYEGKNIQITAVGVDNNGKEIQFIKSNIFYNNSFKKQINRFSATPDNSSKRQKVIIKHLLSPKSALNYMNAWQEKLQKVNGLDEATSYYSQRIRHYNIEKEVILDMAQIANLANIALFLGINSEGKMTTVFVGFDKDNNLILPDSRTLKGETSSSVYDFTSPCPPNGDPNSPLNN